MQIHKSYIALGLIIAFALFFELAAHADTWNEQTKVTFSGPVQIADQVLPAGTYTFQLADPDGNQNIVQIFNADRTVLYTTVETVPISANNYNGQTVVTLAEPASGQTAVVLNWFYPDNSTGHEFVLSKQEQQQLAQARQETFVGNRLISDTANAGD